MVYQSAAGELPIALNVKSWTAAPEQKGTPYRQLPPAVVLDVDETVLDNSPYQMTPMSYSQKMSVPSGPQPK